MMEERTRWKKTVDRRITIANQTSEVSPDESGFDNEGWIGGFESEIWKTRKVKEIGRQETGEELTVNARKLS